MGITLLNSDAAELAETVQELKESLKLLVDSWPTIVVSVLYVAGTVTLIVYCYVRIFRKRKQYDAENNAFGQWAHLATGRVVDVTRKFRMVDAGTYDSDGRSESRREDYNRVTYEYYADGLRYTTKRSFNLGESIPQEHEFLYDPAQPKKAYWSKGELHPQGKGMGRGCLLGFGTWIGFTLLIGLLLRLLGMD